MFYVDYTIQNSYNSGIAVEGHARYEDENEMYIDLEVQGIVEENPNVKTVDYFELNVLPDGTCSIARRWDFGKPNPNGFWNKVA